MTNHIRSMLSVPALLCLLCLVSGATALAGPVNINTADAATLARELKGIGLKRAQAIVDYRGKYGPFRSADELALVKGIGPKAIEANRADIRVDVRPGQAQPQPGVRAPARPAAAEAQTPGNAAGKR